MVCAGDMTKGQNVSDAAPFHSIRRDMFGHCSQKNFHFIESTSVRELSCAHSIVSSTNFFCVIKRREIKRVSRKTHRLAFTVDYFVILFDSMITVLSLIHSLWLNCHRSTLLVSAIKHNLTSIGEWTSSSCVELLLSDCNDEKKEPKKSINHASGKEETRQDMKWRRIPAGTLLQPIFIYFTIFRSSLWCWAQEDGLFCGG